MSVLNFLNNLNRKEDRVKQKMSMLMFYLITLPPSNNATAKEFCAHQAHTLPLSTESLRFFGDAIQVGWSQPQPGD